MEYCDQLPADWVAELVGWIAGVDQADEEMEGR